MVICMTAKNARLPWIDLLRAIAIVGVVLCHCTENIYHFRLDDLIQLSSQSRIFFFTSFCLGRLSVPIFLFISGTLLLAKGYDTERIKRFYRHSWLHLAICTIIWFAIYELNEMYFFGVTITPLQFVEGLVFVREIRMPHGWYMPMILGAYLLIPFIACAFEKYNKKEFVLPLIILTIYAFCYVPFYISQRVYDPKTNLKLMFTMGSSAIGYMLYMVYGQLLRRGLIKKIRTCVVILLSIVFFVSLVLFQEWAYQNNYVYNVWYDNILVLITAMFVYEAISRIRKIPLYKFVGLISKFSFSVYLVHYLVLWRILKLITSLSLSKPLTVILLTASTFTISFIVCFVISIIPKVGNYIFYIREIKNSPRKDA